MDDWPSHTAELDRKTTDVIERYTSAYDAGTITKREYFILISALYDTTSGLIPKPTSDLLADIHRDLRSA
jgi:hypothetical protein